MSARKAARFMLITLIGLAAAAALASGCQKNPSAGVYVPSGDVEFTGPTDGEALNASVINVRGRAAVGTLVNVYLDGGHVGSAVAYTSGGSGLFTVDAVDLGTQEGKRTLVAIASDGAGHEAAEGDTITITLDTTAPPADLESIDEAAWDDAEDLWLAPFPQLIAQGRTDTTAGIVRVRHELSCFTPSEADTYAAGPGEPDSVRVKITVRRPVFGPSQIGSLAVYSFEALDAAENYTQDLFTVHWLADTTACSFDLAVETMVYEVTHFSDTLHTRIYVLPTAVDRGDTIFSEGHPEHYVPSIDRSWFFFIDRDCQEAYPHDCSYLFVNVEHCYDRDGFVGSRPPERLERMVTAASW